MNYKFKVITAILFLALSFVPAAFADSVVRVGLTDNKFQNVLKQQVTVYGTADCEICDKETRKVIAAVPENTEISIKSGTNGLEISAKGRNQTLRDVVIICPRGVLGVKGLTRKGLPALYHGPC